MSFNHELEIDDMINNLSHFKGLENSFLCYRTTNAKPAILHD